MAALAIAAFAGNVILLVVFAQLLRERAATRRDFAAERGHWRAERAASREAHNANSARLLEELVKATNALPSQVRELEAAHAEQLGELADAFERERHDWRGQQRELLNRIQHPHLLPAGVRPVGPAPEAPTDTPGARARRAWASVGRIAEPQSPSNNAGDELGDQVP